MEKDTLTKKLILKDIARSRKNYTPLKRKRKDYIVFLALFGTAMFAGVMICEFVKDTPLVLMLLLIPAGYGVIRRIINTRTPKDLTADDLYVEKKVLSFVRSESLKLIDQPRSGSHANVMTFVFEDGSKWEAPSDFYCWSENYAMGRQTLANTSEKGDVFYAAKKKEDGSIVYAYNEKFFTYEEK